MDIKQFNAGIKKKILNLGETPVEFIHRVVTLMEISAEELNDAQQRSDAMRGHFLAFLMILCGSWGCEEEEAVRRLDELNNLSRYDNDGNDRLLALPYKDYLKSEHWQGVREYALLRAKGRCQLCNSPDRLQVHHRTYKGKGAEDYADVVALCHKCHAKFHGKE